MSTPPRKPADFSNVRSKVSSSEPATADFGNVRATVSSTEQSTDGTAVTGRIYTVVSGDTLSGIAKRFYGKANRWPRIFEANRDQLDNPDRIRPGQLLRIPADDAPSPLIQGRSPPESQR